MAVHANGTGFLGQACLGKLRQNPYTMLMIKDRELGRALVADAMANNPTAKASLNRMARRRNRRKGFKSRNTTELKTKVK